MPILSRASSAVLLGVLSLSTAACPPPDPCNGYSELCERPLDAVTLIKTHNAHASEARGYLEVSRNHFEAIPRQLADGVRALNVDVYDVEGELIVCHGVCEYGFQDFQGLLAEVLGFLERNPREVITLDFQKECSTERLVDALETSGLAALAHTQTPGDPWPTLGEMIEADQRIVMWTKGVDGAPAWLHEQDTIKYGTPWGAAALDELSCDLEGDALSHGILELEHTLTNPVASPELAESANSDPFLHDRLVECAGVHGKKANLVAVDYYSQGDVLTTVPAFNFEELGE